MPDPIASALEEIVRRAVRDVVRAELAEWKAAAAAAAAPDEDRLLTLTETRERLRISNSKLWEMRRKGEISGRNIGRRVLFLESDVNALVNKDS